MGLGDAYNNVNKNPIYSSGISTGTPVTRERDPKSIKLEQDVFSKMQQVVSKPKEESKKIQSVNIQQVGLEQALKELLNGVESLDDKS
tara:strand:+ start:260 stop:523 length:264 start_codon:yes stop_codon:yes gene_type:complete